VATYPLLPGAYPRLIHQWILASLPKLKWALAFAFITQMTFLYDSVVDPDLLIPDPNLAFRKVQTFFKIERKKNPLYFANKFSVCGLDPKKVTAMVLCSSWSHKIG
jgi:hypothetical protein